MEELVIVALPDATDAVNKFSSEKQAHLTLLYLGEPDYTPDEMTNVIEYVQHAASQVERFGLEVERRGELGPQRADVLFFSKPWAKNMFKFRSNLLQNELINRAYLEADQWPEWTPHLTMGFPDKPAKKDDRDYNRFSYVRFDRIAIWTGDSIGPTFQLKSYDHDMEVAMSETGENIAAAVLADLEEDAVQYGVPGMKWGKRKGRASGPGSGRPASKDHNRAVTANQIVKKSGVKALSNDELKALVKRIELEQQFQKIRPASKATKARKFVASTMSQIGKQQINMVLNQAINAQVANALSKGKK